MTRTRFSRIVPTVAATALALAQASCAAERPVAAIAAPDVLAPSPNATLALVAAANGVQIYQCREKTDAPGTWLYHCHVESHMMNGMIGIYRVTR